ncbi:hypothetical protein AKJ16_DCAP04331 [Drosera capensis]
MLLKWEKSELIYILNCDLRVAVRRG